MPSPDVKPGAAAVRHIVEDVHCVDVRASRTVAERSLEPVDRLRVAVGVRFHTAVGEVADPPVHPFAAGHGLREISEPDALHASADEITARDPHRTRDYTGKT